MLTVALDNVRLDSVPIHNSTYKIFLAYNGTLGYSNKVFTTVVKEIKGTFDSSNIPVLSFDPGMVSRLVVRCWMKLIDIKMFNGSVDVLRYAQGDCITEKNILRKESRLSYSNYRHAKHDGRQGNYGWVVFIYSNYFFEI
jgi:hypothetical protein